MTVFEALPNKKVGNLKKHLFRFYDSNNDGFVDFVEFMVLVTQLRI